MGNFKTLTCMGLLTLSFSNILAQEGNHLSLAQTVEYALENSFLIRETDLQNTNADNELNLAKSQFLPQISAYLNYFQYLAKPTYIFPEEEGNILSGSNSSTPYPVELGLDFNLYTGIGVSQVIFDGRWLNKKDIIKQTESLKQLRQDNAQEQIIYNVTSLYYNIISIQNQNKLIEDNITALKKLLQVIEIQHQNGLIRLSQVQGLQVKINNLEANRRKSNANLDQLVMRLKFLMGMPFNEELTIDTNISDEPETIINTLRIRSTSNQLLIQQREMEISNQKNIRATYLPTLKGYASFQFQAQRSELNFFSNEQWFSTHLFGIGLNIPIMSGLYKKAEIQKSNVNLSLIDLNMEKLENQTSYEYLSAKSQLKNAREQIEGQVQNTELADKVYNETLVGYEQGIVSLSDLMETQSALREAESFYQNAIFDFKMAELNLFKVSGNLKSLLN